MARVEGRAETLTSVHSTLRESFLASDLAENHQIPRSLARVTLAAVLNNERNSTPNSNVVRTLLDIIRAEESLANHPNRHHFTGKTTWKSFKERLKLRRNTANPTCSLHNRNDWMPTTSAPQPDAISPQVQILTQNSLRDTLRMSDSSGADSALPENDTVMREEGDQRRRSIRLSDALAAEREERSRMSRELEATREGSFGAANVGDGEIAQEEEEPVRMSLMDLLEETERQSGLLGPIYRFDDDHDGEEGVEVPDANEEVEGKGVEGVAEVSCCVCMVRHKGAAFIPCGHTFCRMCSRELWVQRGHCPLCNSFILEVLDIF